MNGKNIDTHVHSTYSADGKSTIEEMCASALEKGMRVICFTEHFDMDPNDASRGFFDFSAYSDAIKRAQDEYSGKLRVLKGLEFSEPHLYRKELEHFNSLDFDFILGSVHWVDGSWIGDESYVSGHSVEELFERHFSETVRASEAGMFDSLAHVDFPRRYLGAKIEPEGLLRRIAGNLVSNGISLEVNTSPLRKGLAEQFPSEGILDIYAEAGGEHLTLGSDAHCARDIGACFDAVAERDGLRFCYYERRKRVFFD